MIKFRLHRALLEDAMKTVVEVEDMAALDAHVRKMCPELGETGPGIEVVPYSMEPDDRIGWQNTYLVCSRAGGLPLGFCEIPPRAEFRT